MNRPLWLVERVEFEFVGIETRRQANGRRGISRLETDALAARNELYFYVLSALGKTRSEMNL